MCACKVRACKIILATYACMDASPEAAAQLRRFLKVVSQLCAQAQRISVKRPADQEKAGAEGASSSASPFLDAAMGHLMHAQAMHALSMLLLKAKGMDSAKGILASELDRIGQYKKKVNIIDLGAEECARILPIRIYRSARPNPSTFSGPSGLPDPSILLRLIASSLIQFPI